MSDEICVLVDLASQPMIERHQVGSALMCRAELVIKKVFKPPLSKGKNIIPIFYNFEHRQLPQLKLLLTVGSPECYLRFTLHRHFLSLS